MRSLSMLNNNNSKRSRLDRNVDVLIKNPDETPSRKAGISESIERLHRLHGTSIIFESARGEGLKLGTSTCATACTVFHRFFHSSSLTSHDVWSVAMASTLLATKLEEESKSLKQIIEEYSKVYSRRLVLADVVHDDDDDDPTKENDLKSSPHLACLPLTRKQRRYVCEKQRHRTIQKKYQNMNKFGPVYKEWYAQLVKMEAIVLRQLGFTFYWISDSLPHKFILYFCKALELKDKTVTQRVWNYCNDSYRLDLSVRYRPEVIAAGAILLAARDFNIILPMKPRPWWEVFLGSENTKAANELVDAANSILAMCTLCLYKDDKKKGLITNQNQKDDDDIKASCQCQHDDVKNNNDRSSSLCIDWLVASKGYARSMVHISGEENNDEKFLDPDSFLWSYQKETYDNIISNSDDID